MIPNILLSALLLSTPVHASPDSLDAFIRAQMALRKVPGLSLAIVDKGKIVYAKGYGVTAPGGKAPVTTETLFLAGSISKSVAAMGALKLVEAGTLSLDGNVNEKLTTWKVPDNGFTGTEKVTLRRILSHTTGLTVHGFGGYEVGTPVPTITQILDGAPPANSQPVRVDTTPGAFWRYSGGGYTVMQLMMDDVTRTPFEQWMATNVIGPLGMTRSSFQQPPAGAMAPFAAAGQYAPGTPVPGRYHLYPEMAAAGLWTTASDLARFIIGVQQSNAGTANPVISQAMTREMLTSVRNDDGLGVFLDQSSGSLMFFHGGRDDGFDAYMGGYAEGGQGVAIMINANDNSGMMRRILEFVAREYRWPGSAPQFALTPVRVPSARLASWGGRYEAANNQMTTLVPQGGKLVSLVDGLPDRIFVPTGEWQVTSEDQSRRFTFVRNDAGEITGFSRSINGQDRIAPRIGPLLKDVRPARDPDPARTARIDSVVRAMAQGGPAVEQSPMIAGTAKADFAGRAQDVLKGFAGITWLMSEDVSGRGIERHGGTVATVLSYRLNDSKNGAFVLVYLTGDGQVTDYDVVND
jgi:CubicO group peptidase (beta-lactamase class C family)